MINVFKRINIFKRRKDAQNDVLRNMRLKIKIMYILTQFQDKFDICLPRLPSNHVKLKTVRPEGRAPEWNLVSRC